MLINTAMTNSSPDQWVWGMTPEAWLTVIALLIGPVAAVLIQRWRERVRENRAKKLWVFRELMVTRHRGYRLGGRHVDALNSIDVEFYGEKGVLSAWKAYLDLFNNVPAEPTDAATLIWLQKGDDLLVKLLYAMSQMLGYDFDETMLRRNAYVPVAHGQIEDELTAIRKGFFEIFSSKRKLPIEVDFAAEFKDFVSKQQSPAPPSSQSLPAVKEAPGKV